MHQISCHKRRQLFPDKIMLPVILQLTVFILLSLSFSIRYSFAQDMGCEECHKKLYMQIYSFPFQHSDIVMKNCKECHIQLNGFSKWGKVLYENNGHLKGELKSNREAGGPACMNNNCHQPRQNTHPVDIAVSVKSDLKIAEDLPLADGNIITCATCHSPHGGDLAKLLRKEKKALCLSCHMKE